MNTTTFSPTSSKFIAKMTLEHIVKSLTSANWSSIQRANTNGTILQCIQALDNDPMLQKNIEGRANNDNATTFHRLKANITHAVEAADEIAKPSRLDDRALQEIVLLNMGIDSLKNFAADIERDAKVVMRLLDESDADKLNKMDLETLFNLSGINAEQDQRFLSQVTLLKRSVLFQKDGGFSSYDATQFDMPYRIVQSYVLVHKQHVVAVNNGNPKHKKDAVTRERAYSIANEKARKRGLVVVDMPFLVGQIAYYWCLPIKTYEGLFGENDLRTWCCVRPLTDAK